MKLQELEDLDRDQSPAKLMENPGKKKIDKQGSLSRGEEL